MCQNSRKTENFRSTEECLKSLSRQLSKYKQLGGILSDELDCTDAEQLYLHLKKNKATYHKNCCRNYRDDRLEALRKTQITDYKKTNELLKGSQKRSSDWNLGDLKCDICGDDCHANLHMAAEIKRINTSLEAKEYLKEIPEEWQDLIKMPGD